MIFNLYIDTGGTFTDTLASDSDGNWKRLKVLSNSSIRVSVENIYRKKRVDKPDHVNVQINLGKSLPGISSCLVGYPVFRVVDSYYLGTITSIDSDGCGFGLLLHDPSDDRTKVDEVLEIRSPEQAPIFAARLITGTRLDAPLPNLAMRLATTRGTNALLERKGIPPILITNSGLADLPIIGTQQRPDLFALRIDRPNPLHRSVVEVLEGDLDSIIDSLSTVSSKDTPIAVALRDSYLDPKLEIATEKLLVSKGYTCVSRSSHLAPLIRLLPRMQTTIINAYLTPVLDTYLNEVNDAIGSNSLLVMHSAGGLESRDLYHPKDSLLSGPAAGVKGIEAIGNLSGFDKLIGFDMGGTSTDVCRVDGRPDLTFEHQIGDATIFAPMLAIETVAAGGGSLCGIRNGELYVGPESGGAHPGPACYGAGGALTLTDVNLLMGRLSEDGFSIPIHRSHAEKALKEIAQTWDQDPDALLDAWIQLANERMAEAIRRISVRKGYDTADYTLVSFGGAGGQHACEIARLLGIKRVLFPADAGLLSAWGLRFAHREKVTNIQILKPLNDGLAHVNRHLREYEKDAEWMVDQVLFGIRFVGMDSVEWISGWPNDRIEAKFLDQFNRVYGFIPDRSIELESVRIILKHTESQFDSSDILNSTIVSQTHKTQKMRYHGAWHKIEVRNRNTIKADEEIKEPVLVTDPYSTTFIEPGWVTRMDIHGSLIAEYVGNTAYPELVAQSELARLSLDAARLQAIALEMGEQLQRTAISVNVKERLDFSCAILDTDGYLVVNAPHIPVHLGALGMCVRSVMKTITMGSGDVIVTNHPAYGGSHLPDVTVISPVYSESGTHIGFVANRAHHAEIGGIRPGSMPPSASCLAQEGVVIPPTHLFKNGEADWDALRLLFTSAPYPSRNPDENIADLQAAVAANRLGEERLIALSLTIGEKRLRDSMVDLRQYASNRMRDEVTLWDWDQTEAKEMLDDGSILKVKLQRTNEHVTVDFTGSADVHEGNLNATPAIVHSVIMYVMRTLILEAMPLNEGIMEPVQIILPEGMLNPAFTDDPFMCPAVVGGNVETSQRLVDTILKAFGVVACSQGTMNNLLFGNERFGYYETICGGTGAGPDFNGADGVHHHMTNTRITDPEILEWRYPVRLEQFSIRRGSGGQGVFRGGDGIIRKLRFKEAVDLSIVSQHRNVAPYGMDGGEAGLTGRQWIERENGDIQLLGGIDQARLEAGDSFVIETPGGGGFGDSVAKL